MDVRRLLTTTRKWIPLLVAGVVVAAIAGFGISSLQQKTYESKTTLIVGQSLSSTSPDYSGLMASQELATTYATIAATNSQLDSVITQLHLSTTTDNLATRVTAAVIPGSSLLTITVVDTDPGRAAAIANALAEGLIQEVSPSTGQQDTFQTSLSAALASTQDQITRTDASVQALLAITGRTATQDAELATLQGQLVTLRSAYATLLGMSATAGATNTLAVVDPAVPPTTTVGPRTLLNTLIAAVIGLLIAVGIAALVEFRSDKVGGTDEIEREARARVLTTIGQLKVPDGWGKYPLITVMAPRTGAAEAYRTLRANIEFASVDKKLSSLLVTSAQPGEGKTMTAANIAVAFAQAGRRVLLIDGDLRLPAVQTVFSTHNEVGLTTALVVESIPPGRLIMESGQPNLWILPSGPLPPNPAELLASQRMRALLETVEATYDLVVLDSSPLAAVSDAAVLGSLVTATVLVVDVERGRRRSLLRARDQLARAGASVIGVVANRAPGARGLDESGQYGGYLRLAAQPAGPATNAAPAPPAAVAPPDKPRAAARRTTR